jgi:hypothetical protein
MIREHLFDRRAPADPLFRWRGGDVSRLEALTDVVFAFSLTLIVVSLEVPKSFDDLLQMVKSTPVFAVCFLLLYVYPLKFLFTWLINPLMGLQAEGRSSLRVEEIHKRLVDAEE